MSGQNHKISNSAKKNSGHTTKYSPPFFSYRTKDMLYSDKDIRCNPKVSQIGKVHRSVKS